MDGAVGGMCLLGAFLVTYGVEKLIVLQRAGFSLIPGVLRPYLWQLFPTWLFYFVLGMAATRENLGRLQQFAARHKAAIAAAAVVFTGLYVLESKATGDIEAIKSPLNVYVPLVLLAVFALWPPPGRPPQVDAASDGISGPPLHDGVLRPCTDPLHAA